MSDVVALATAARAAGITHLRLRRGPVAELVLLPPDPPAEAAAAGEPEAPDLELLRREREARLRGGA